MQNNLEFNQKNTVPNCVIVDANAIVHSSFHAIEPKLDKKGKDQRILYGLLSSLLDLAYKLPSIDELYLVFDPEDGYLYRKSQYSLYKENRPPQDPLIKEQKESAIFILEEKLGICNIKYNGFEADDTIGTLAKLKAKTSKVWVVSPDKDLLQLVEPNTILVKKIKRKGEKGYDFITYHDVKEKFGLYPHQIPDWIALMGDSIDNLPGLDGVGNKTAIKLLNQYLSIEHLLAIAHELENVKLKEQILHKKDTLLLVKNLATVKNDLPISEILRVSQDKSMNIRNHENYHQNLYQMQRFFNWNEAFMGLLR